MKKISQQFIYGLHPVKTLLLNDPKKIEVIYVMQDRNDQRLQQILELIQRYSLPMQILAREKISAMVENSQHQGVVAVLRENREKKALDEAALKTFLAELTVPPFLLILDGVQDPHNLGACLRSANAAGVHAVIAPKDRAVGLTPVVRKVASGAAELTPFFQVTNLARTLRFLQEQNIWLYGASEKATTSLYEMDAKGGIGLVLGAEGSGLRQLTQTCCDYLIYIPTPGQINSLNVAVATGICLFEVVRQRSKNTT